MTETLHPALLAKAILVVEERKGKPKEDDWELAEAAEYLAQAYKELAASRVVCGDLRFAVEAHLHIIHDCNRELTMTPKSNKVLNLRRRLILPVAPMLDMLVYLGVNIQDAGAELGLFGVIDSVSCKPYPDADTRIGLESETFEDLSEDVGILKNLLSAGWVIVPEENVTSKEELDEIANRPSAEGE